MEVIHCKDFDEMLDIPNKNGCYITEKGNKFYYNNNLLHRDGDLPAMEFGDGSKQWYRNGLRHRIDGPAIEYSNGKKRWFLFIKEYSECAYEKIMDNLPLFYWNNRDMLWK